MGIARKTCIELTLQFHGDMELLTKLSTSFMDEPLNENKRKRKDRTFQLMDQ